MSQTTTLSAPHKLKQMLREEIQNSAELMRWHIKERNNEISNAMFNFFGSLIGMSLFFAIILWVIAIPPSWPIYLSAFLIVLFVTAIATLLEDLPKTNFTYVVAEKGIAIAKSKATPDWGYPLLRGIAWFAVIVCLITAMMVGPMAFAGTAGFALLGFKFINAQRPVSSFG